MPTAADSERVERPAPAARIRVLVADDSAVYARTLCRLLEAQPDIEVVGLASNGEEAVALARSLRPDVVLMDLFMPAGGGLAAIRRIVADSSGARIIGITAAPDAALHARCISAGAQTVVRKAEADALLLPLVRGERTPVC